MVVHRKRGRLRAVRLLIVGLAALLLPVLVPPAASADTAKVDVLWIRCQDQSESGSDEILIYVNGQFKGGWGDVDVRETHWYYSAFPPTLLNIQFDDTALIEVFEADGSDHELLGWVWVSASEINQGEHEGLASQGSGDGEYIVRYQVHG
ncbi:MAG TPA: hypothetical protein VGR06_21270 [Actinophytocola sp.]|jgi:hypothetical protein|uniref:hypothetical protein n=1 Tax=Actinophytocola sp. TaxID=1872138 RepID=UPI002E03FC9F|nr:hypothetical protein [Actinophytocola sp.]